MGTFIRVDRYQRLIISVLFRIILTAYSIVLIAIKTPDYAWYVNVGFFVVYWVIFLFLWGKNGWYSIGRIFADFVLIFLVLYQLHSFTFLEYSLLFLPILNCQNHTSDKRTILVYILPLAIVYILYEKVDLILVIPFLVFFIINSFESIRTKYFKFIEDLNSRIDDFFISSTTNARPYSIYKEVIPIFNKSSLFRFTIGDIICLKLNNKKLRIVNGSFFTWELEFMDKTDSYNKINKTIDSGFLFNVPLKINNEEYDKNLVLIYTINSQHYCYVIFPKKQNYYFDLKLPIFIPKLVQPFFLRLSKVLEADSIQKAHHYEEIKKVSEKYSYVNKAEKAIHHINNHMTPFTNLSALAKRFEASKSDDEKNRIIRLMQKDATSIQTSLPSILERADLILDKPQNPFNVSALEKIGIQKLYTRVKNIWDYHFEEQKFEVNWDTSKNRRRADVSLNIDGIDLIISNWLSNVKRYNSGTFGVNFNESEQLYIIDFYNSYKDETAITQMLELYNASEKSQVFRSSSHGIFHIKECLEQMHIEGELLKEDNIIHFRLNFKKLFLDEDTSI